MNLKNIKLFILSVFTLTFQTHANAENSTDNKSLSQVQAAIEDTFTIEEERVLVKAIKENESAQNALNLTVDKITTDIRSGKLTELSIASYLGDYLTTLEATNTPPSIIQLQKQMANDAKQRIVKQNTPRREIFRYFLNNISQLKQPTNPEEKRQLPDSIIVDFSRLLGAFHNSPEVRKHLIDNQIDTTGFELKLEP